jgi:ParB family chromosome partitioning protein
VRESEVLCKKATASVASRRKNKTAKDHQIASLEEKLIQSLGTKVRLIHKSNKQGKIEIEYYSLEELDRLLEILMP